jgi:antitoxin component of MazEF toxin-antitoxin module
MRIRVQRWGSGLAVRIPKPFADRLRWRPSTEVEVSLAKVGLRIHPAKPQWRLDKLLSRIGKRNLPDNVESGPAVGREVW